MEIALSCDMIVANRNAKFGIPEVKRGLAAAAGGLIRMPRQMPIRVAMEFALTGEFFGAERAYELGIINRLTDGPALDAALELAAAIGANGPLAVKASKQVIVESRLWPEDEMWKKQQEIVGPVFVSGDAREGAAAFAEKRAPNWKGK
jgi:enoyl-CoA hydratase